MSTIFPFFPPHTVAPSLSPGALHDELRLRGATAAAALCQAADLGDFEEPAGDGIGSLIFFSPNIAIDNCNL